MLNLKQKVEILCEINNMTLTALADMIGIAKSTIARWDRSVPSGDTLLKLSQIFKVTPQSLLSKSETLDTTEPELDDQKVIQEITELLALLHLSRPASEIAKDMLISIKKNVDKSKSTSDN